MPGAQRRGGGAGGGGERRERRGEGRGAAAGAPATAYLERVVAINRVAKVVKGGRRFSFTALVIVGDGDGQVGVGYGKAKEVPAAIAKGVEEAKKNFFRVPRVGGTIPHPIQGEAAAGVVLLRPASAGTGVIAGGPVRAVLECAGVHDVLSKSLGSDNAINVVHATVAALKALQRPEEVAARRGLPLEDVAPAFEGGQMPIHMRLPKLKGFKNRFRTEYQPVNVGDIAGAFPEGGTIGVDELVAAGLVRKGKLVKVLGDGEVSVKLNVTAN